MKSIFPFSSPASSFGPKIGIKLIPKNWTFLIKFVVYTAIPLDLVEPNPVKTKWQKSRIGMYNYYYALPVTRSWLLWLELLFNSNQRQVYGWPTTVQQKVIKIGDNFSTPFKSKQKHFLDRKSLVSKPLSVNLELDIRRRKKDQFPKIYFRKTKFEYFQLLYFI